MPPYSRPQLWMLLALVVFGALGVAVGGWRRAYPDLAERVERFDIAEPAASASPAPDPLSVRPPSRGAAARALATEAPAAPGRPAKVTAADGPFDLNRATRADLERLPGVGPALAERILSVRDNQPFSSVDDLRRVPGIGATKLERLRPFLTVPE